MSDWIGIVATIVLGGVGLYLAHSVSRQARVTRETEAIKKRFTVYSELWKATKRAAPMNEKLGDEPLSHEDRRELYNTLTTWFWDKDGGMVLGEPSRTIYLNAKKNLRERDGGLWPASARAWVMEPTQEADRERRCSELAHRQLSLLRTAMRADLGIIGRVYSKPPDEVDKDFLRRSGVRLWKRPWWDGTLRGWVVARVRERPIRDLGA
jgi:hypothetical protein